MRWLLTALAIVGGSSDAAASVGPRIATTVRWEGAACNPEGRLVVTVRNVGDAPAVVPRGTTLGFGQAVEVRITSAGSRTVGSNYRSFPYSPTVETPEGSRILQPSETYDYPTRLGRPDDDGPSDPVIEAYAAMRAQGGALTARYQIRPAIYAALTPADPDAPLPESLRCPA